ncbi:MAG: acetate kinase [Eubacteriales bacterium]|nr:acetate kinase [Eubacteriales bacterium]
MNILVINAGSSSLKYQLMDMDHETIIAKGICERIGIEGSNLQHRPTGKEQVRIEKPMSNHIQAMRMVLDALTDPTHGVITSMDEIGAVGHRVLHGGEKFAGSFIIDDDVMAVVRENIPLGPLHNPANIMGIEACREVMPATPMVAVFDTAFHQTMPPKAFMYALPQDYYKRLRVRKYGFHGTSHRYVSRRAAQFLGRQEQGLRIVTCHLGNGSSMAAVKDGKCIDTSMGLTPLEGMVMGTRSGDLDPAVVGFICEQDGIDVQEAMSILNKKSGLLGISGFSSDMRDLLNAIDEGNADARLALDMFCYRIRKYIGSYAAAMGGVDAVVFTAGIGENNAIIRELCVEGLEFMGIKINHEKNALRGGERDISADDATVRTLIIPTDEELVIARDTLELVENLPGKPA